MNQNGKTGDELDIILKKKPGFFIRWGLMIFVAIVITLLLLAHYKGYEIFTIFNTKL